MYKFVSGIGRVKLSQEEISDIFDNIETEIETVKEKSELDIIKDKLSEISKVVDMIKESPILKPFLSSELNYDGNK